MKEIKLNQGKYIRGNILRKIRNYLILNKTKLTDKNQGIVLQK